METNHHYVNSSVVTKNMSSYQKDQNLLANHEQLLSLQEALTKDSGATGKPIATAPKSKSLSDFMAHAFSKKMTLKPTKSYVAPSISLDKPTTSGANNGNGPAAALDHQKGIISVNKNRKSSKKVSNPVPDKNRYNRNNTNKTSNILNDKKAKYTILKNPTLILRDVKNSVAQRFKSKHSGCSNFEKFHDEACTPVSAKLYSPFNVFTDSIKTQFSSKLNQECADNDPYTTPKRKLPTKKDKLNQLRQQKLIFDSPTGNLRESVNDVEQFQLDIKRINADICAREDQSDAMLN